MKGSVAMSQVPPEALREVVEAFKRYVREVEQAPLRPSTKRTYLLHAGNFVRWLKGDFSPGATLGGGAERPFDLE